MAKNANSLLEYTVIACIASFLIALYPLYLFGCAVRRYLRHPDRSHTGCWQSVVSYVEL